MISRSRVVSQKFLEEVEACSLQGLTPVPPPPAQERGIFDLKGRGPIGMFTMRWYKRSGPSMWPGRKPGDIYFSLRILNCAVPSPSLRESGGSSRSAGRQGG